MERSEITAEEERDDGLVEGASDPHGQQGSYGGE